MTSDRSRRISNRCPFFLACLARENVGEFRCSLLVHLRHSLQLVEIAKSPISENKFELVSDVAAAFKTLWQQCQTLSSIENS